MPSRKPKQKKHIGGTKYDNAYLLKASSYIADGNNLYVADIDDKTKMAEDPITGKNIRKENAFIHYDQLYDIENIYEWVIKKNGQRDPITGQTYTKDDKTMIINEHQKLLDFKKFQEVFEKFGDSHVYHNENNENSVEFRDTLHENDIIILNNNKAIYIADQELKQTPEKHRYIHGKSNTIVPIKVKSIKDYCRISDDNCSELSSRIHQRPASDNDKLLNITNYYMHHIANIISHFQYINFYSKRSLYRQITITDEVKKIINEYGKNVKFNIVVLLNEFKIPSHITSIKLSNKKEALATSEPDDISPNSFSSISTGGSEKIKSKKYYPIRNGGDSKYVVDIQQKQIIITDLETKGTYEIKEYKNVFVGKSTNKYDKNYAKKPFTGCSILVEIKPLEYIYICDKILKFKTKEPITLYVSQMGNSSVVYPFALTENYAYLIIENVYLKRDFGNIDPYQVYYDHKKVWNHKSYRFATKEIKTK